MFYRDLFSERLSLLRNRNNISMRQLGDALGISDEAVRLLERAKRSPSFEVLLAIADHFNVSLDYLVGRSDDPERR